ncbi:MAG: ABC transporter permease subunit [Planctomycetota bacterium]
MTRTPSPNASPAEPATLGPTTSVRNRATAKIRAKGSLYFALFLLLAPTLISMLVFGYYPKLDVVVKAFYRWNPGVVEEFIGLQHFRTALADDLFWQSFQLVGILLAANLVKMWPAILTALALHHMVSDRWRYVFQVSFVVPMVIPAIVWLLVWKSFYEPDFGLFNRILNGTGLMHLFAWLDGERIPQTVEGVVTAISPSGEPITQTVQHDAYAGGLPALAQLMDPILNGWFATNAVGEKIMVQSLVDGAIVSQPQLLFPGLEQLIGGVWALLAIGAFLLALPVNRESASGRLGDLLAIVGVGLLLPLWGLVSSTEGGSIAVIAMLVATVAAFVVLARRVGSAWVLWAFLMIAAAGIYYEQTWRVPITLAVVGLVYEAVRALTDRFAADSFRSLGGWSVLGLGSLLILLCEVWVRPIGQFEYGAPAWLGNRDLIIPALIFWGFPWVGTVGVLIYLAGLQQISTDVYEAAELDGVGPIGRIFKIELPLIMTQVRINLIFMTIGTLTGYEMFLILLGIDGGPGNRGMVPGLYMFSKAFLSQEYGYACALGLVLFVMILLLTVVYQRYVKVDK